MECKAERENPVDIQPIRVEIDTLWNVKALSADVSGVLRTSRNRYIVECKVDIEPIRILFSLVEIDTLWNVKTEPKEPEGSEDEVEIDTLWNVKYGFAPTLHRYRLSRNRYIVECKAFSRLHR